MKGDVFMRYSSIRDMDVVNGIGIACSLFVQGCSHHCYNCFNQETWDFKGGEEWTKEIEDKFISLCNRPYIDCVSILGGEPFDQGEHFYWFLQRLRHEVGKPIFVWSGYTYEQLIIKDVPRDCLREGLVDYLIDGEFIDSLKDYKLHLIGSSNQRIIDVNKTIESEKIILAKELY